MTLFFVTAEVDDASVDWFVRARTPRDAYRHWRNVDHVTNVFGDTVEIEPTTIYEVPPSFGPSGGIAWDECNSWSGTQESDFPDRFDVGVVTGRFSA